MRLHCRIGGKLQYLPQKFVIVWGLRSDIEKYFEQIFLQNIYREKFVENNYRQNFREL